MTDLIVEALRLRYPGSAYALITELRNHTGHSGGQERYADAIVMGCWPSRGLDIDGFEFKVSRSDWLNELKHPEKAEAFVQYCHRWWMIEGEKGIVKDGELPKTWGLMTLKDKKLRITVQAPELPKPKEPDRALVASILRSFVNQSVTQKQLTKAKDAGYQDGMKRGEEYAKAELEGWRKKVERMDKDHQHMIDEFEKASGVRILQYNSGQVGDAVKRVLHGEHLQVEDRLRRLKDTVDSLQGFVDEAIKRAGVNGWT